MLHNLNGDGESAKFAHNSSVSCTSADTKDIFTEFDIIFFNMK